uniref:Uncharacterized protein n=1 Tax=Arundo donax TaxID=35708 RepID=A0A0A8ZYR1_ARUDO
MHTDSTYTIGTKLDCIKFNQPTLVN